MKILNWLCAAVVVFTLISWYAVGTPETTTSLLWAVEDFLEDSRDQAHDYSFSTGGGGVVQRDQIDENAPRPLGEITPWPAGGSWEPSRYKRAE